MTPHGAAWALGTAPCTDTLMGQPVLCAHTFDRDTFPALDAHLVMKAIANSAALGMPEFREYLPGPCSWPSVLSSLSFPDHQLNPNYLDHRIG